jgi:non-specific protein-tyrosine kinase
MAGRVLVSDDSIQLRDQVGVLRRRWLVVATTVLLAVGLGVMFYLLQTPVYVASTEVLLAERSDGTEVTPAQIATQAKVVGSYADEVIEEENLAESPSDFLDTVTVTPDESGAAIISISVSRSNGDEAAAIANGLAEFYLDESDANSKERIADLDQNIENLDIQITSLGSEIRDTQPGPTRLRLESSRRSLIAQRTLLIEARANIVVQSQTRAEGGQFEEAVAPANPTSPDLVRDLGLAVVLGLLVGIGAAYLRDYFDDVVRDESGLGDELGHYPVLAHIPHWRTGAGEPIALSAPREPASEAYRELAANTRPLLTSRIPSTVPRAEGKVVLVGSGSPAEGKTVTAVNLAVVAASAGQRVLLLDANLRLPGVHTTVGLPQSPGLVEVLTGTASAQSVMASIGVQNLHVLPAGTTPLNPAELLTSQGLQQLLTELRRTYDLVVVDSAAVLPVADVMGIATQADVTMLVVRARASKSAEVAEAVHRIERAGGSVAGLVMNEVPTKVDRNARAYYASGAGKSRRDRAGSETGKPHLSSGGHIIPGFQDGTATDPEADSPRSA